MTGLSWQSLVSERCSNAIYIYITHNIYITVYYVFHDLFSCDLCARTLHTYTHTSHIHTHTQIEWCVSGCHVCNKGVKCFQLSICFNWQCLKAFTTRKELINYLIISESIASYCHQLHHIVLSVAKGSKPLNYKVHRRLQTDHK